MGKSYERFAINKKRRKKQSLFYIFIGKKVTIHDTRSWTIATTLQQGFVALLERNRVALLERFLSRSWEKPVALSRRCRAYFYSAPALQPMKIFDVFFLRYFFFHEIDSHFDF